MCVLLLAQALILSSCMRLLRAVFTAVARLHAVACGVSGSCWLHGLMSQVTYCYVIVLTLSQARFFALYMASSTP